MNKPHSPKNYTHYAYLSSPIAPTQEPTALFDLSVASVATRRSLIHAIMMNGELLAPMPFEGINNMRHLRDALGLHKS